MIKNIPDESIDLILSDIPYGINYCEWDVLHNNTNSALLGSSPSQKNSKTVFRSRGKPLNGWSQADKNIPKEYYNWCLKWSPDWLRVLKPGASCFIFAGRRLCHRCICAMEDSGFIFKDMLALEKDMAAYKAQNVSSVLQRRNDILNSEKWNGWKVGNLRPLFEPILWFMKPYPIGSTLTDNILNNSLGAFNENELKERTTLNSGLEKCANLIKAKTCKTDRGLHPAQKAVNLMEILITLVTIEGQTVLDPFCGSGSTGVACTNTNRNFIGMELNDVYFEIAEKRINEAKK